MNLCARRLWATFRAIHLWAAACLWITSASAASSFTTHDGFKYAYDYTPAQGDNATVLFLHGFPGTRHDWQSQVADLTAAGYGAITPDLLGFGDTDKPTEVEAYNRKNIAGNIVELIDDLGLDTVVGVGHDWGAVVLSSLAVFYPEHFDKFIYLSVGYVAPGTLVEVDSINRMTLDQLGYMVYGYWYFFNTVDAESLIQNNLESAFHMMFPTNNSAWAETFVDLGAARAWLQANKTTPLPSYLDQEQKDAWLSAFGKDGDIDAAMKFYKAIMRGVQYEHEKVLTDADRMINVPVLTISGTQDMIGLADQIPLLTGPWVSSEYTARKVDAGHWLMFEQSEAVSSLILEFLAPAPAKPKRSISNLLSFK